VLHLRAVTMAEAIPAGSTAGAGFIAKQLFPSGR
jgi:hypothetical protein